MGLAILIQEYRALQRGIRRGPMDWWRLEMERAALEAALLQAQRAELLPGEAPRRRLRADAALVVALEHPQGWQRAVTADLSEGGFGAYVGLPPELGKEIGFGMMIPGGDKIVGRVQPLMHKAHHFRPRVAFEFRALASRDRQLVRDFVFETVLAGYELCLRAPASRLDRELTPAAG